MVVKEAREMRRHRKAQIVGNDDEDVLALGNRRSFSRRLGATDAARQANRSRAG